LKGVKMESKRLILRRYIEEDAVELYNTLNDENVLHYIPEDKITMEEAKNAVKWLISNYDKGLDEDYKYSYVVESKETGEYMGWCGFGYLDFDRSKTEIYYTLKSKFWNKGYATEAMELIMDEINRLQIENVVVLVKEDNLSSKRVIEKLGFKFVRVVEDMEDEFKFYEGELHYERKNN
jgi:ribosomal-protein-alanine N-acetyltransferase